MTTATPAGLKCLQGCLWNINRSGNILDYCTSKKTVYPYIAQALDVPLVIRAREVDFEYYTQGKTTLQRCIIGNCDIPTHIKDVRVYNSTINNLVLGNYHNQYANKNSQYIELADTTINTLSLTNFEVLPTISITGGLQLFKINVRNVNFGNCISLYNHIYYNNVPKVYNNADTHLYITGSVNFYCGILNELVIFCKRCNSGKVFMELGEIEYNALLKNTELHKLFKQNPDIVVKQVKTY